MPNDFAITFAPRSSVPQTKIAEQQYSQPISRGLSSVSSKLETAQREQVGSFGFHFLDSLYDSCLAFLRRFLPCFFSVDTSAAYSQELLSDYAIRNRISLCNPYLQRQFGGIEHRRVSNAKVIVILRYHGMTEVCYRHLNDGASLSLLKTDATYKLTSLIQNPIHRNATHAIFSIATLTYSPPEEPIPGRTIRHLHAQNDDLTFPENQFSHHDGEATLPELREETQARIRTLIGSAETQREIERFLF